MPSPNTHTLVRTLNMQERDHWHTTTSTESQDMILSSDEDSAPATPLSLNLQGAQEHDGNIPDSSPQVPSFVDLETGTCNHLTVLHHNCVMVYPFVESDSSDLEEDTTEVWNEEEQDELLRDLQLSDSVPPTDSQLDSTPVESQALKMGCTFSHVHSNDLQVIKYCCFSCVTFFPCFPKCSRPV